MSKHGGFYLAMVTWRNIEIYTIKAEEGRYLQLPLFNLTTIR
nr:MAG TPA: hypothetical protein [Caudoviricetes sp.]